MLTTIDAVISTEELQQVQQWVEQADWLDGTSSAGRHVRAIKDNLEMDQRCESWRHINELVVKRLYQHPEFQRCALPHKVSAAFVARYRGEMRYGKHVDDAVMGAANARYRSDIAVTVFLKPPESYQGGELTIHTSFGTHTVKLEAGCAVVYPASSLHEVAAVTSGERLVCVLWVQSLVRRADQREVLVRLSEARDALHISAPQARVTESIDHAYMNLVRMWYDA